MEALKEEDAKLMKVKAVWQFFEAERRGNSIELFAPGGLRPIHVFSFGRQRRQDGLCLSDYILDPADGRRDHLAFFVVTAGECTLRKSADLQPSAADLPTHGVPAP